MAESPFSPSSDLPGKASVLLLSGFLGAGKTTLLKRILSWQTDLTDTVVLVNEFGEVGIDGALLEVSGSGVVELTSGCICCTLSADLKQSLHAIWDRFQPRRIFIESTGAADPNGVIEVLMNEDLAGLLTIEKIVTVLDAISGKRGRILDHSSFVNLDVPI
jgi:G3E family GTPase